MMSNRFQSGSRSSARPAGNWAAMRNRALFHCLGALAMLAMLAGLVSPVGAQGTSNPAEIPANLMPPAGAVLVFELGARGVQIYACEPKPDDASSFVWTFKAPEAELLNQNRETVGSHFAGPTWQGNDGSAVIGEVVERADAPENGAIPWLLLAAKDHEGNGLFSTTTHVQRLNTEGGVAPAEGCDADHEGAEARIPYEATYAFFYAAAASATPAA